MILDRGDRLHSMSLADILSARLRKAEVPDLAFRDQLLDGARDVFHRYGRIDTVLIEQVDMVGPQALQRSLDHLADMLGPAIEPDHLVLLVDLEAELRADQNLVPNRLQRLANQLLVDEGTIALRGVE
jgi:hypothetical protein